MDLDLSRAERLLDFDPRQAPVPYLPGWQLPQRFKVTWDDKASPLVSLDVAVDAEEGRPRCIEVTVTARRYPYEITGTELRAVTVAGLLADAIAYAVIREGRRMPSRFDSPEEFAKFRQSHPVHRERERWALTPEHLREVVRIYRQGGRAGVMAVAEHFNRPRATASRWVALARAEGYFDKTERKRSRR